MLNLFRMTAFLLVTSLFIAGCEDKKDMDGDSTQSTSTSNSSSVSSGIVGTWRLQSADHVWYVHFGSDGNWNITDDQAAAGRTRVYGPYKVSGSSFSGTMTNPGVGTGRIEGNFSGSSMNFTFIEGWHSPEKVIQYTGTKL